MHSGIAVGAHNEGLAVCQVFHRDGSNRRVHGHNRGPNVPESSGNQFFRSKAAPVITLVAQRADLIPRLNFLKGTGFGVAEFHRVRRVAQ